MKVDGGDSSVAEAGRMHASGCVSVSATVLLGLEENINCATALLGLAENINCTDADGRGTCSHRIQQGRST